MADEKFSDNLLRAIAAQLHFLCGMTTAREMFGKSYFALGAVERAAVDQTVTGMVASSYQGIMTPEGLATQSAQQPAGFRAHTEGKA